MTLQDLARCRLLLQRLGKLARARLRRLEQLGVLDRDHRLGCEGFKQPDLVIGERLRPVQATNDDRADGNPLTQHRRRQNGTIAMDSCGPGRLCFEKPMFQSSDICNMDRLLRSNGQRPCRARYPESRCRGPSMSFLAVAGGNAVDRHDAELVRHTRCSMPNLAAQMRTAFSSHGLENGFQIAGRTRNDAQAPREIAVCCSSASASCFLHVFGKGSPRPSAGRACLVVLQRRVFIAAEERCTAAAAIPSMQST